MQVMLRFFTKTTWNIERFVCTYETWQSILCAQLHALWMTSIPHQLRTYLIDGPVLYQNTYKGFQTSYSLKYKHSKKKFIYEKINGSVRSRINIQESSINKKSNNTVSVMFCTGANFVKKNSCLVAKIVSFDTACMQLLI